MPDLLPDFWYLTAISADTPIDRRMVCNQAIQQAIDAEFLTVEQLPQAVVAAKVKNGRIFIKISIAEAA
jgi:hypothetical protein